MGCHGFWQVGGNLEKIQSYKIGCFEILRIVKWIINRESKY